ncbi:MAG: glycine zipper 2TM domain-containing protein [Thiogranum sp.]
MRRIIAAIPIGVTVLTSCGTVPSGPAVPGYVDTAEVIQAEPLYKPVQVAHPVNECWIERVTYGNPGHNAYAGPVAGGIIGGVLGNQLASGRGRTAMTVAGTLLGASVGHRLSAASYRPPTTADVRRCTTRNRYEQRQQLVGYRVDYRYEGQTFTTRTNRHPGRFIRVRVNVDPVDGT